MVGSLYRHKSDSDLSKIASGESDNDFSCSDNELELCAGQRRFTKKSKKIKKQQKRSGANLINTYLYMVNYFAVALLVTLHQTFMEHYQLHTSILSLEVM